MKRLKTRRLVRCRRVPCDGATGGHFGPLSLLPFRTGCGRTAQETKQITV